MMANPLRPMMSSSPGNLRRTPATGATTTGSYTDIDHIDKLDEHTVKVVFKEPTAFWYDAFFGHRGHILPKHLFAQYKGQEARNAPYNLKPVGTGPYKIVDFKPGDVALYEMQYAVPRAQPARSLTQ